MQICFGKAHICSPQLDTCWRLTAEGGGENRLDLMGHFQQLGTVFFHERKWKENNNNKKGCKVVFTLTVTETPLKRLDKQAVWLMWHSFRAGPLVSICLPLLVPRDSCQTQPPALFTQLSLLPSESIASVDGVTLTTRLPDVPEANRRPSQRQLVCQAHHSHIFS